MNPEYQSRASSDYQLQIAINQWIFHFMHVRGILRWLKCKNLFMSDDKDNGRQLMAYSHIGPFGPGELKTTCKLE